jgi:hypothetical protein
MSDNANGGSAFLQRADAQNISDGETLGVKNFQHMMRFQSHFGRRIELHRGEHPRRHRRGQGHHNMPQGGE